MKKGIIARGIVAAACVIGVGIATVGCQAKPTGNVESETATTVVETEAAEESTVAETEATAAESEENEERTEEETILSGDGTGSENSALKVLALDASGASLVLTYQVGDTEKTQTFDYNMDDYYYIPEEYWLNGFDHLEGDLTGDGIDEVIINIYIPNDLVETGCVTYIYTLNGDTLVELPCVLEDYFENSVLLMGDEMRIEDGNLYVSGAFKVCGVGWDENRCLTYTNGTWTEQYRQKFPDMEEPYGDRSFNDAAEIMATVKNDCEMQPERMQTIYPFLYSTYQNNELEKLINEYYF